MNPSSDNLCTHTPESPTSVSGFTRTWKARSPKLHHGDLIDRFFKAREISDDGQQGFMNPSLLDMHDPSLIPDLDRAAERILQAISHQEQIVIFGDYDVDGVTASTILIQMIKCIDNDSNVRSYIPHRVDEGYGLNINAIDHLHSQGTGLVVTVDCGITAMAESKHAKDIGLDLIITDHHNPPKSMADLPEAFAVVHPRRPDSQYPFGELCGAGVAYKLAWRMATLHSGNIRLPLNLKTALIDSLVYAALGTIADIVPLVDENRAIVKHGLSRIRSIPNDGLQSLIQAAGLDSDKIDTEAVGFRLAPRLNAIGRLGHAKDALELLTTAVGSRAVQLAEELSHMNEVRRREEQAILQQAINLAEDQGMTDEREHAIILKHNDWHTGIVGIVCSRMVERYAKPVILMHESDGVLKGSGRSIEGFNLHGALEHCSGLLEGFGGHDMAAGLSCTSEHFEDFKLLLLKYCKEQIESHQLVHIARYDTEAALHELTPESIRQLERAAPFGAGNPRVKLRINNLQLNGQPTVMGKTGQHLALRVGDFNHSGSMLRIVAWNWAQHAHRIPSGSRVEVIVEPKLSTWNGTTKVEPVLVDLRVV